MKTAGYENVFNRQGGFVDEVYYTFIVTLIRIEHKYIEYLNS